MYYDDSILTIREYGKVILRLKEILDERGITRNALARKINTRFEVVDKWYSGEIEKLDLDILARICYVLGCEVTDIIKYERADGQQAGE